ncbi:MAG: UvrD-helicase domain-containing protein [Gemmiger sp.]
MAETIRFTPAQADAIQARGGSLLVSAAAGSGKTRVLVERAVRLIADPDHPVDADSLLIMTFTNAAAAKLRAEIAERLAAEVRADPSNTRLRRQQLRLQRASIGTVDAFCLHFLQEHFTQLDIPPDFETADEAALYRIRQETLSAVLEGAYADADFRAFADLYDRGRADDTTGSVVLSLYDFVRTLPNPDRQLDGFLAMWQTDDPPQDTPWGRELMRRAAARTAGAQRMAEAALRLTAKDDAAAAAYTAALQSDLDRYRLVRDKLEHGDWEGAFEALNSGEKWKPPGRIKGGVGANPTASAAKELRDRAKKQLEAVQKDLILCTGAEFAADRARARPLLAALVRTVKEFSARYYQNKLAEKLLDYSDFEHLTLQLLQTPEGGRSALCETVSRRYSAVLVDEYQDTNALQDAIYFSLANPDASNLFFVGDVKQSIYRFRQADPSVFIQKQRSWPPYDRGIQQSGPAAVALDANFRSAPNVIAGVNYLFGRLCSPRLGGVEYGPGQRLVVGNPQTDVPGLCELDVLPGADTAADADAVAARIVSMVAEGFAVRGKEGVRPCEYGDFCILLRGRADFDTYESALKARGVPVYADTAADLLDAPHVRPFAALLRVVDNPAQDVELAAVLLSPMFAFTPDDLVALRNAAPRGSLYGALLASERKDFAAFRDTLDVYRRLARTLPVDALLEELFARTGYLAAVGAMPDGARCRDDLRAFAAWASGAGRAGLPALIRAMNAAQAGGGLAQGGGAGQSRPGHVAIMTVHRSKGLEFPVVFVANTTRKFNLSDAVSPVLYHRELGVGLMLRPGGLPRRYKTMPYAALAQAIRSESLSEEMRVLYVALTRAQDALIVTVPAKKLETELKAPALYVQADATGPETLQNLGSWGAWLLTAALGHPAGRELWAQTDYLPHDEPSDAPLTVRILAPAGQPQEEPACEPAAPDEALKEQLLQNFAWRSPERALREVPAKVSVTAVTHATGQILLERPAFLQKSGLTGAERGTAIHAFLQNLPLDASDIDLEAEKQRQIDVRLLDAELAARLDLGVVQRFLDSAAWRRLRSAKRVLREEPFITALPAGQIEPDAAATDADVLVQGIADLVLVFDGRAEILDYKTDASTDPEYYRREYGGQLRLYRRAFALRLQTPVDKLTIYSFSIGGEVDIPLEGPLRAAP